MFSRISLLTLLTSLPILAVQAQTLTDPTRPVNVDWSASASDDRQADGFPALKLEAVFISEHGRYAIIDGATLNEGDKFKGFTLMSVTSKGIVLAGEVRGAPMQRRFLLTQNNDIKKYSSNDF